MRLGNHKHFFCAPRIGRSWVRLLLVSVVRGHLQQLSGFYPQDKVPNDIMARVIRFNDSDGDEFWLGYHNFYVISRYNPRAKYAMVVYQLSKEIEK